MGRCLFCGKDRLRMYQLPDSESRHVFCDACGAAGPWGDTHEEARSLYSAVRLISHPCKWLWTLEGDHEGFWTVQCKENEDWPVSLLHEGAMFCSFCGGRLAVEGVSDATTTTEEHRDGED